MAYQGSSDFEAYARTLRRVFWSEFLDRQLGPATEPAYPADMQAREPAIAVYPAPAEVESQRR